MPADIQAQFLSKLAGYDRNFAARAGATAWCSSSRRAAALKGRLSAAEMKTALGHLDRIGGFRTRRRVVPYEGAENVAAHCRSAQIAAVYVTPGFDDEIDHLRTALADVNVMTVAAARPGLRAGGDGADRIRPAVRQAEAPHQPRSGKATASSTSLPKVLVLMKVYR